MPVSALALGFKEACRRIETRAECVDTLQIAANLVRNLLTDPKDLAYAPALSLAEGLHLLLESTK